MVDKNKNTNNAENEGSENESTEKQEEPQNQEIACCNTEVHIAYRGKADDRLYVAYNRKWLELRYFQANGLKAFCAVCRHRVL